MTAPFTTAEYVAKAKAVHGDKYDYSKSVYTKAHNKIIITCHKHGEFSQLAYSHLAGNHCRKCAAVHRKVINTVKYGGPSPNHCSDVKTKTKATNLVKYGSATPQQNKIVRAKTKATNLIKYGVEHVLQNKLIYEKFKLTCQQKYGVAHHSQTHLVDFLPLLNDKQWCTDQYQLQQKSTTTIAMEIGATDGVVRDYLISHGIDTSIRSYYSDSAQQWFKYLNSQCNQHIQTASNGGEFKIPGTRYKADGYCRETNTIYEFHGDYWHGNPGKYCSTYINKVVGKTMGELYAKTLIKENTIRQLGYNLVVMWESEWNALRGPQ